MNDDNTKAPILPNLPELQSAEESRPKRRRFFRFFLWSLIFLLAMIVLVALGVGYWARQFYAPIDVETADTTRLAGWIALRDLSKETPETQQDLAEKYFEPLKHDVVIDWDAPLAQKILPYTQKYVETRDRLLDDWEKTRGTKKLLRRDYTLDPSSGGAVRSNDVLPAADLIERLNALKKSGKPAVPPPATSVERNIRLMMKSWFLHNMTLFDQAPDDAKGDVLESAADQMLRLQNLYNDYREKIGLNRLSDLELLRDFDFMVSSWYDDTPIDELARLLWFKDLTVTVLIAKKSGLPLKIDQMIFRRKNDSKEENGSLLRSIFSRKQVPSDTNAPPDKTADKPAEPEKPADSNAPESDDEFF